MTSFTWIVALLQIILAAGLINVWLVRFYKPTKYRGKGAGNMEQEFHAYGLPTWFMYLIGTAKMLIAALLVIGFWIPSVVMPAAGVLVLLMIGAVAMHIKVRDAFVRMVPALAMLAMAAAVVYLSI